MKFSTFKKLSVPSRIYSETLHRKFHKSVEYENSSELGAGEIKAVNFIKDVRRKPLFEIRIGYDLDFRALICLCSFNLQNVLFDSYFKLNYNTILLKKLPRRCKDIYKFRIYNATTKQRKNPSNQRQQLKHP